jgi:osmotically-inducible protein OsmY
MRIDRTSHAALALGVALALGIGGCANHMGAKQVSNSGEAGHRGAVQTVSDATINTKVKAALVADEMVKAREINVDTLRGVVTLNGTVHSAAEKNQAINLARKVEGVADVKDNLKVSG